MYITLYYNVHIHIFCAVCLILESELKWATGDSSKYYVGYENIQPQYVSLRRSHTGFSTPPFLFVEMSDTHAGTIKYRKGQK